MSKSSARKSTPSKHARRVTTLANPHPIAPEHPSAPVTSYGQILRSSSIIAGSNAINYVVGLFRIKIVAVLLGPAGVGLVGLYVQISGTIGTLANLGIGSSAVRQIAESNGSGNETRIAATVKTLRRACWATGVLGWLLAAVLAKPLSHWIFDDASHAKAIGLLGATILFNTISGGQTALLQGIRRIGDLARIQVLASLLNALVAIGLFAWLGERGIVPVLLSTAAIQLAISWYFTRRVEPAPIHLSFRETVHYTKGLISFGLAFMWSGLLTALVLLAIRALIIRELGVDSNGLYQAAWAISGMFAGFILGAMGADFYPRLTAVANQHDAVNRLVNEQTEIGVLLALPGLIGTLAFAPWLMQLLYSAKFLPAAGLLPWFVFGILGQVVSWPLGFIMLAQGAKSWFVATETLANLLKLGFSFWLINALGLVGTAIAMPALYLCYIAIVRAVSSRLTGFRWTAQVLTLFLIAGLLTLAAFLATKMLPQIPALILGGALTAGSVLFSLRELAKRLGHKHPIIQSALRIPGCRVILGA